MPPVYEAHGELAVCPTQDERAIFRDENVRERHRRSSVQDLLRVVDHKAPAHPNQPQATPKGHLFGGVTFCLLLCGLLERMITITH